MKHYILILGLFMYWHESFGMCSPSVLGRTIGRLPSINTDAFTQQELPLNTVQQKCNYATGGVVVNYPSGWFTQAPNVRVTIEPATINSTLQYSAHIVASTATSTTIRVVKYETADACESKCIGGVCANSPYCTGGNCAPSSLTSTCPNCNGSCSTTCIACAGSVCVSQCFRCQGTCEGFCGGTGSGCTGFSLNCASCQGYGEDCDNCIGFNEAGICAGTGTTCTACSGVCSSFTGNCLGTATTCNNQCLGTGPCNALTRVGSCYRGVTCSYTTSSISEVTTSWGNGPAGSCLDQVDGYCSEVNAGECRGLCSLCASVDPTGQFRVGDCNGVDATDTPCDGFCTICTGSCYGTTPVGSPFNGDFRNVPPCLGEVSGQCGVTMGTSWNGYALRCFGDCSGTGSALSGATCAGECNAANTAVEVAANEVLVHVYAITDI